MGFSLTDPWSGDYAADMGMSPGEYQKLQQRLSGRGRKTVGTTTTEASPESGPRKFGRILGIDPSLRGTGYGVIEAAGQGGRLLVAGTLKCPASWPRSRCWAFIASELRRVVQQHAPEGCAVEGLFFAQNLRTAITLGEARGAALSVVAEAGLPIFELAPRAVKQSIVGFGGAQKLAVAKMVQRMLGLETPPDPDAADALAVALALMQSAGARVSQRLKPL